MLTSALGLYGTPAFKVESACASGGAAVNLAYSLVKAGAIDSALVVGVEKMRDMEPEAASQALAMAESAEYTQFVGATFAALNGLVARSYLEKTGTTRDELSAIPVLDHKNAVSSAHAQFRKAITPEVVGRSSMVADPLRLFDCAPVGDGAAALMIVGEKSAGPGKKVELLGSKISTAEFSVYERKDMLDFSASRTAFQGALAEAGVPQKKLDFAEIHDAFSVVGALSVEAMGFSKKGMGAKDAKTGKFDLAGDIPINTFGGLKARGHPVGATGVYQLAEGYMQLTDTAGGNQVKDADFGMTQNIGGVDTTSAVHILGRAE